MELENIIYQLKTLGIRSVSDDTRYLEANDAFICRQGQNYHGQDFVIEAILKGAKAIISEIPIDTITVPVIICNNIEKHFPNILIHIYGRPWERIKLIGITGTDGKTTTATILQYLINHFEPCGYIGTNGISFFQIKENSTYTTLPLCLLMKTLAKMANAGIKYCTMEASSEGLINNRLENIIFHSAIFTNLTHEHLDTHINMENYFQAKLRLFSLLDPLGFLITNKDCPYGQLIYYPQLFTFSINSISDYQAINIKQFEKGISFDLIMSNKIIKDIKINMIGKYNIYNVLAAIICAYKCNFPINTIIRALETIPKIPGRLQEITYNENYKVFIDFAHTPNALRELLMSLKKQDSKMTVVLGAAGEKDKTKRPDMGKVACDIADHVIFTSEDPRKEKPENIIREMTSKITSNNYEIILNRKFAINYAIASAKSNDIIVITGKGNDNYFEDNNNIYPYSDILEAKLALKKRKQKRH